MSQIEIDALKYIEINKFLQPQTKIETTRSIIFIYDSFILKFREYEVSVDSEQIKKVSRLEDIQGYLESQEKCFLNGKLYIVKKLKKFPNDSVYANMLCKEFNIICSDLVFSSFLKIKEAFQQIEYNRNEFWEGIHWNFYKQMAWAQKNHHESDTYWINHAYIKLADKAIFSFERLRPSLFLGHGDMHAGNIYISNDSAVFLDPVETDRRHCLVPIWAEMASLGASGILLGRNQLLSRIVDNCSGTFNSFELNFFNLWVIVKCLVRIRFESINITKNEKNHPQNSIWQNEISVFGWARLVDFCKRISDEKLDQSEKNENLSITIANQIAETLEHRRSEINAKANVYLVASAAIIAGIIGITSKTSTTTFWFSEILLLSSLLITIYAALKVLEMVRRLPKKNDDVKSRGQLFFFGWLAKKDYRYIENNINNITKEKYIREITLQTKALSDNLKFRYQAMKDARFLIVIAMFFLAFSIISENKTIQYSLSLFVKFFKHLFA